MKTATGHITRKTRIPTNPGFTYTVETQVDKEFNFEPGQPITLVDVHPQDLFARVPSAKRVEPRPAIAAQLNATHVGKRIRVETLDGSVIEDTLESIGIVLKELGAVIHVDFKNVSPRAPQQFTPAFRVAPEAPVTIIEETK